MTEKSKSRAKTPPKAKEAPRKPDKGKELLEIVRQMEQVKNIPREVVFTGIEAALQQACERQFGEEPEITVSIDRLTGKYTGTRGGEVIDSDQMEEIIGSMGRIIAQSVKQMMIGKMREAECESQYEEFIRLKGELIKGTITRVDSGTAIVTLPKGEAILPKSETIPGETHQVTDQIKAIVLEVRKTGHRVKVVLSRCHPDFVRCLFEKEIPEVADRTIEIRSVAREAGYRSKVAVSSIDSKVDCVGACVGVRGNRIKNIIDELNGERIDIVRWNDSLQVMIPNALQPAQIEEVFLYHRLGRAIVLVPEDQLSLAIGRRGQNVRLASKLVQMDIEIMTAEELTESTERAIRWFSEIPNVTDQMIEAFLTEGMMSFEDLSFQDPVELAALVGISEEEADDIIAYAEEAAERVEAEAKANPPEPKPRPSQPKSLAATVFPDDLQPASSETSSEAKASFDALFSSEEPAHSEETTVETAIGEPVAEEAGRVEEFSDTLPAGDGTSETVISAPTEMAEGEANATPPEITGESHSEITSESHSEITGESHSEAVPQVLTEPAPEEPAL